jgi:HNH endonuclease
VVERSHGDTISLDVRLKAYAAAASILEWPLPRVRHEAVCDEGARLVDRLLVRVARGRGALDVAIGEALLSLAQGDRVVRLGYSCIGDYAREVLGIAASTAQKMARLARKLQDRPLLRAAVRAGEVTARQAEAVLPVACGDAEPAWVERARRERVRALKAAVKNPAAEETEEDEPWMRLRAQVPPEWRPAVDQAMELGGKADRVTTPRWRRVQGVCEEFLGAHAAPEAEGGADPLLSASSAEFDEPEREWLEKETAQWAFLGEPEPVAAPESLEDAEADVRALDAGLRRLARMRERWGDVLGHLAMLFRKMDGWRRLGFASFDHYCEERLGICPRAVEQRAALERRLYELPTLRKALGERRLSYEKARLIARHADEESIESWIALAERLTCIELQRHLQDGEERQMCARGEFEVWMPRRVAALFLLACRAVRKDAGRWMSPGECLGRMAAHFVDVWKPALTGRSTPQRRILARDKGFCQVRGCSRAADHVHHIEFRSAGGSDDPSNLVSLCATHHLRGIHMGYIRVTGKAPDRLRWELAIGGEL